MAERERKPTLSLPEPELTPKERANAMFAGRIARGANVLLAGGLITPEQYRNVLRAVAPHVQPVIDALVRQHKDAPLSRGKGEGE
jgi:hypothetical protein